MRRAGSPIKRIALKEQAYNYLKNAILEVEIESRGIYSEQHFADRLNVSRTPIREAVLQLSQEGLVEIHPHLGVSIRELSAAEIEELFQVRTAIEGYCRKTAAEGARTPQ